MNDSPFVANSFDPAADPILPPSASHITEVPSLPEKKGLTPTEVDTALMRQMIHRMKDELDAMLRVLQGNTIGAKDFRPHLETIAVGAHIQIFEGTFTGNMMKTTEGKEYSVPPNYASKSKLVEGDRMKLTITPSGAFIYKQIAQIERDRVTGELTLDPGTGQWQVLVDGKPYKVLTASVTFYHGKPGDKVSILIPKGIEASWGAMENIIQAQIR